MNYFVLGGPYCSDGSEFDFDPAEWTARGEARKCELCDRFLAMLPLIAPVRGVLCAEKSIFDLSQTSGGDILISEKCLRAFEANGILGIVEPTKIELLGVEGPFLLEAIGMLFIAGSEYGAEVDRTKSGLKSSDRAVCPMCGSAGIIGGYDRIAIVDSSWTGKDLFSLRGLPGVILLTERLQRLCTNHNLAICNTVPAEDYRMPTSIR